MQLNFAQIQPYDLARDGRALVDLWQQALGDMWPLNGKRMQKVLTGPYARHFVLYEDDALVGFVATSQSVKEQARIGHLAALLVAPRKQRQGIGTVLHEAALAYLRAAGCITLRLGATSPRFWCGVPTDLPSAVSFFRQRGWEYTETVYDLAADIHDFTIPAPITERMRREGIVFESVTARNYNDVLAFETREFPHWLPHYERYAQLGDYADLLTARDQRRSVVGALILYSPQSHTARTDLIWQALLGEEAGAMGAVGAAQSERGRGIGLALVAYGSATLKERGVRNCYIDWVVLTDFYARLGYEKWRAYYLSSERYTDS